MGETDARQNDEALNREVREAWNENAGFWDNRMGEGNDFHKILIEPAQLRLLGLQPEERVLDIACGNGQFARAMAALGARVLACDFAPRMLEAARARTAPGADRIEYRLLDATDEAQLLSLGPRRFDAAVCTMALMDMARLEPLAAALARLLKPGSRFVFSLCHPCFNSGRTQLVTESQDHEQGPILEHWVKVARYIHPFSHLGVAMVGQPVPHRYFHRPLGVLLAPFFAAGLCLDALEEPVFGDQAAPDNFFQTAYKRIPPALVGRLRLG